MSSYESQARNEKISETSRPGNSIAVAMMKRTMSRFSEFTFLIQTEKSRRLIYRAEFGKQTKLYKNLQQTQENMQMFTKKCMPACRIMISCIHFLV